MPRVSYVKVLEVERILLANGYMGWEKFNTLASRIRQLLSEYYSRYEGLVFQTAPEFFTILPGRTTYEDERKIHLIINQIAPHGISFASVVHEKPYITLLIASRLLTRKPGFTYLDGFSGKYIIGIFDYRHELPRSDIASSIFISKEYCKEISKLAFRLGGVFLDCGFSRSVVLLDPSSTRELEELNLEFKIGVGEGNTPVQAFANAEKSLSLNVSSV